MVAAVVTVAVTIVNGMVTIAQRRLKAEVELARIADEGQTNRLRTVGGRRAPAVRVKYRQEALRLVRVYWPRDLAEATRTAVRAVEDLGDLLEQAARPAEEARTAVGQLRRRLEEVAELPGPKRFPVTLTGLDYLAAVESVLARPAERLRQDARSALRLLEEELTPLLPTTGSDVDAGEAMYLYDIGTVAQDLVDDLAQVCDRADVLSRAVAEVEKASSDFVGADLRDANLDGVLLEGILWDAATVWPADYRRWSAGRPCRPRPTGRSWSWRPTPATARFPPTPDLRPAGRAGRPVRPRTAGPGRTPSR